MLRKRNPVLLIALVVMMLASLVFSVSAQEITPRDGDEIDPNANISWPPPVYVLRGQVEIRGSANIENLANYFIEFRPLVLPPTDEEAAAEEDEEEAPWFPATLPSSQTVQEDILGVWDTETAPDGLYELRLVLNVRGGRPVYFYVSPLRVENEPPPFVVVEGGENVAATATSPVERPTAAAATPTVADTTPRATARLNANVRSGDNTTLYPVIATLQANVAVPIIGVSSNGTGWYLIELPNGTRGWIAPSVVDVSGNLAGLPRIAPPPPPATPTPVFTPTPIATATPISSVDIQADAFAPNPNPPTCNVPFTVQVNIANRGTGPANNFFNVIIRDVHVASNQEAARVERRVDRLLVSGENYVVSAQLNVSIFYNEQHRIEVIIDPLSEVAETNESNNIQTFFYTLQRGAC
jgi:hypothetical protein